MNCASVPCDRLESLLAARFKLSEFARFIAPLVQGLEAAVAGFMDEQGRVPKAGIRRAF